MGQHPRAQIPVRGRGSQRRRRTVQHRPARAVPGARRAAGAQAGHFQRPPARRAATVRGLIWDFCASLKAYRRKPNRRMCLALRARFDRIFRRRTGFVALDRLLARLHANKAELLMVLERPEIPLYANGSENDIRCYVTRRKVSAGTQSDAGRDCRDAFLGLAKTCTKPGIAVWDHLGSRPGVTGCTHVKPLDHYVRARTRPA